MVKFISKIIKIIGALAAVLFLILIAANLKDDELRPEVLQALNWQVPEGAFDKENGYVLMHGMHAPLGHDPYIIGKEILEKEITRYQIFLKTHIEPTAAVETNINLLSNLSEKQCKYVDTQNCVDFYLKDSNISITSQLAALKPFDDKFSTIKKSKKFVEITPPMITFSLPSYSPLTQSLEIQRVLAILEISSGDLDAGIHRLVENNQFSRRLLKESSTLITHMIALSMIHRDARVISELMIKYPMIATLHKEKILRALSPILAPEYSPKKYIRYENNLSSSVFSNIEYQIEDAEINMNVWQRIAFIPRKYGFLKNNTLNLNYDFHTAYEMLAVSAASELNENINKSNLEKEKLLGLGYSFLHIRNPVGKILVAIGEPNYKNYIERHHDLDGYLTLVRLQQKLSSDKVTKDQLPQVMANFPNPYTLQAMRIDDDKGLIVFDGRQPANGNFNRSNMVHFALPQ